MVAYSYRERFIPKIEAEIKQQTLRGDRPRHARPTEEVQHYFGMRTKWCRLIGRSTCVAVNPITINFSRNTVDIGSRDIIHLARGLDHFAAKDGFSSWEDLREFWRLEHGKRAMRGGVLLLPKAWSGFIIEWRAFRLPQKAEAA